MQNLSTAPTLTTERLVLRGPERDDLPEFTRFMTSAPSLKAQGETITAEQAWFGFLAGIGHWHWHGFGFFTVVELQSGHPVGRVGLIKHSNWPDAELAWHLFEGAEGKGYATESGKAALNYAFNTMKINELYATTEIGNQASHHALLKIGLHYVEDFYYQVKG